MGTEMSPVGKLGTKGSYDGDVPPRGVDGLLEMLPANIGGRNTCLSLLPDDARLLGGDALSPLMGDLRCVVRFPDPGGSNFMRPAGSKPPDSGPLASSSTWMKLSPELLSVTTAGAALRSKALSEEVALQLRESSKQEWSVLGLEYMVLYTLGE